MAIYLHRDALRFDDPAAVVAGAVVTGTLTVVATRAGRMAPLEAVLVVRTLLDGVSDVRRHPPVVLAPARRIAAGQVQVPFRWTVPPDAPPSFELGDLFCDARLLLRFRRIFATEFPEPIVIGSRAPAHGSAAAVEVATATLACVLPSRRLQLGRRVEVEVRGPGSRPVGADVDAQLIGTVIRRGRTPQLRQLAIELIATRDGAPAGDAERWEYFVPHNLPATFASSWWTTAWELRVTAHGAADAPPATPVVLPVGVFGANESPAAAEGMPAWRSPSELASTASATLARIAHEIGWELRHAGDPQGVWDVVIAHPLSVGHLELRFARGARVATLTGRLHGLDLGIGLRASDAPERGYQAPVPGGVQGDERTLWLHAADAAHATVADQALRPALRRRLLGGPLRVSDDAIEVSVPAVPVSAHVLRTLARDLTKVAQAVQRLRAMLGPPSSVAVDAAALAQLVGELGGSVYLPTLTLRGRLGGRHVCTSFVAPRGLRLGLAEVALPRAALLEPEPPPRAAVAALTRGWPQTLQLRSADRGRAVAELDLGASATLAPDRLREALAALAALLDALGPSAGPYR